MGDFLKRQLEALADASLLRRRRLIGSPCRVQLSVDGQDMLSFASNDYLGLAAHPALIEAATRAARHWGVGSGASHLVSGHMQPHDDLETALASFVGAESALFFSTGFMANLGVISALAGRDDAIFSDRLNHASIVDAIQLSRARHIRYRHNDLAHLASLLEKTSARRRFIVTDTVFSMDGDLAHLPELLALAQKADALLFIDDAHGFGVLGSEGRGALDHFNLGFADNLIYMGTLGKAAAVSGAFVAGSATITSWLVQRARSYIYTTGSSPIIAGTLLKSLELIREGDALRDRLDLLANRLETGLAGSQWRFTRSPTAIQPLVIGSNEDAVRVSAALEAEGIYVPAIRPPTVPAGTARLRISLSAGHNIHDIDRLVDALKRQ